MGRKGGRKPKYRSESHGMVVQDYGPAEIWNKSVVVRGYGAEAVRHEMAGYVLRNRAVSEGGVVTSTGTFNRLQCPLDVLREHGHLGDEEQTKRRFEAGEALFELFNNAGIQGKTTATWNSAGGGGIREQDDHQAEDEMRYHRAIRLLGEHKALVMAVCVQHIAPARRKSVIAALNDGLDKLSDHFDRPKTTSCKHEKRVA
jgi:hypothetical protein